jgi:hypothetical protein
MASAKSTKGRAAPDAKQLLDAARAVLQREGVVKMTALGPAATRAALAAELAKEGYEATKSVVRRPLGDQLAAALADGAFVPLKAVASVVSGATAAEAKRAATALVAKGGAKLVLRGTAEVLVPAMAPVLSREQLARFGRLAKVVAKAAASKSGASVLQVDMVEALGEVVPGITVSGRGAERVERRPEGAAPPRDGSGKLTHLLSTLEETRDPQTGLSFVPAIVARLEPEIGAEAVRALLVSAATNGVIELRPEGGIGRLSEQELAVCPPGPQGTRLSWARRLEMEAR